MLLITSLNSCTFLWVNIAKTLEPHLWAFFLVEAFFSGGGATGASGWGSGAGGASCAGVSSMTGASASCEVSVFFLLFFFFSFFSSSP